MMWIAHDHRAARCTAPTALAIGNFDGVHRGHQHLFRCVSEAARGFGGDCVALTFDPHPTRVLAPERAAPVITPLDRKLELLGAQGLDGVVVERFDVARSAQSAEDFVREVIVGLGAREVFIGGDFRFGKGRSGDGALLATLGAKHGFSAHVVSFVESQGAVISSTRVRRCLADGDVAAVRDLLGRPYDLDGIVVHGDHRGRTLGFATANLRTGCEALPRDGVYAVRVRVLGESTARVGGVANLGNRPTFAAGRSIEIHLLDTDRDLYGRTLRVEFTARLRDERRFDGIDALRAQITHDVGAARAALATESETP